MQICLCTSRVLHGDTLPVSIAGNGLLCIAESLHSAAFSENRLLEMRPVGVHYCAFSHSGRNRAVAYLDRDFISDAFANLRKSCAKSEDSSQS